MKMGSAILSGPEPGAARMLPILPQGETARNVCTGECGFNPKRTRATTP